MEDQDPHAGGLPGIGSYSSAPMPARQKYRLRARSDREIIREVEPGKPTSTATPARSSRSWARCCRSRPRPASLPYAVENLRLCGCSLEQLVQKDLNDCPHCGRRLPAVER